MDNPATTQQPAPTPRAGAPAVWDLVIRDMRARDNFGADKYNTRLQPFNGRDAIADAYQEALDFTVYLRQLLVERERAVELLEEHLKWLSTPEGKNAKSIDLIIATFREVEKSIKILKGEYRA